MRGAQLADAGRNPAQLVKHASITNIWDLYEVGDMLGSGMSGAVHVVRRKETGDTFAMKTVNTNRILPDALEDLRSEIQLLKEVRCAEGGFGAECEIDAPPAGQIDHPNVIKLYETYEDRRHMYLVRQRGQKGGARRARASSLSLLPQVMELCTGGELYDRLVSQKHKRCATIAPVVGSRVHDALHHRSYTEKVAAGLVLQMCKAVSYIHGKNICHRDLKCASWLRAGWGWGRSRGQQSG